MSTRIKARGVSLVEVLVALMMSVLLISMTTGIYNLFRRGTATQQVGAGLAQNGRVVLDRVSRELRQTPVLVTALPADITDTSVPQPGQIEFEDGHAGDLSYRRYYIDGTVLKLQTKYYYMPASPSVRVRWSQENIDAGMLSSVIATVDVADQVQSLTAFGDRLVQLIVTTSDGGNQTFVVRTSILLRNA